MYPTPAMPSSAPVQRQPELIIAPPSPPCSPQSMRYGLAGFHRAPNRRYPQPRCVRPSAIVPRARFRLAHPAPPKKSAPEPEVMHADEWMILKLDEDMSDAEDGFVSDGGDSLDEVYGRPTERLRSDDHPSMSGARSLPVPVPVRAPVRVPLSRVTGGTRLRCNLRIPPMTSSNRTNNGASRRYRYSSSYSSSDDEADEYY